MTMLNVSPELYQELAKLAEAKGLAANDLAEAVLDYYIKGSAINAINPHLIQKIPG
jgi:hypothetical protein